MKKNATILFVIVLLISVPLYTFSSGQEEVKKEAKPEKDWLDHATTAIKRSDVFIVMLGSQTKSSAGVRKEVAVAKELAKTRFQIIGYRDGASTWAVPDGGRVYSWNWDNLKKLLG